MAVAEHSVDAHGHDDHGLVAHHFHDIEQQRESATLGMWLFLAQEVMFFGGMLAAYTVYRVSYPETWTACSNHLGLELGFVNTLVLLCSSLTMAFSVRAAMQGNSKALFNRMVLTLIFGSVFLGVKVIEYSDKWNHSLVPGIKFAVDPALGDPRAQQLFFVLYFVLTGMHALHMIIGIGILLVLLYLAKRRKKFVRGDYMPVELFGFYWHFVDIVWVFLFPLLYLVDRSAAAGMH